LPAGRQLRTKTVKGGDWRRLKDGATGIKNCPDSDYMEWLNRKIDSNENTI